MTFSALDGRRIAVWGIGRETRSFARHVAARLPRAQITTVVLDDVTTGAADGFVDGARLVAAAEVVDAAAGFDVLVFTDHWRLTRMPSTPHLLVMTGAELAVDPLGPERYSEILAIGIDELPQYRKRTELAHRALDLGLVGRRDFQA